MDYIKDWKVCCPHCGVRNKRIERYERDRYDMGIFKCEFCWEYFKVIQDFEGLYGMKKLNLGPCQICGKKEGLKFETKAPFEPYQKICRECKLEVIEKYKNPKQKPLSDRIKKYVRKINRITRR